MLFFLIEIKLIRPHSERYGTDNPTDVETFSNLRRWELALYFVHVRLFFMHTRGNCCLLSSFSSSVAPPPSLGALFTFPWSCGSLFIDRRWETPSKLLPHIKADLIVSPLCQFCCSKTGRQGKPQKKSCSRCPPETHQWGDKKLWRGKGGWDDCGNVWVSTRVCNSSWCFCVRAFAGPWELAAQGFDMLMRLIVVVAANEITMRSGRPSRRHCLTPY